MTHSTCLRCSCVTVGLLVATSPCLAQQFVEETSTRFPVPNPIQYTNQLTIGDLDNDGDLDIIFANGGNYSSPGTPQVQRVYINDGSGVFTDESEDRLGDYVGLCRGVELGDIDGDGDLDIIFAQDFNRLPSLLVNDGGGFFTDVTATQLPDITLASSRAQFGDIDNDGDLDLYIVSGTNSRFDCGQYRVYVNDGDGFFTDETELRHPLGNVCNNMDAIFGDIDNDFDLDVLTASTGTNNSRLYRNDGMGVFSQVSLPANSSVYSYDFGDMDGDGDLDILGANAGSGVREQLLENDGAGNYTDVSDRIAPNPNEDDNDNKFFDYDNDGDLDFIIARLGSRAEKIYENDGSANFTQTSGVIQSITDSSLDLMVADLDNDGDLDIVTAQGESGNFENRIYHNTTGPADTVPPNVALTEQHDDTGDPIGPYVIRALIYDGMSSDRNFFDRGVTLNYALNNGPLHQVAMRHSGGQVYRGVIPGQAEGGTIEYFVTAADWNDNLGTGDTLFFDVTPGASATLDDIAVTQGSLVTGVVGNLIESDDVYVQTRSQFGFSAFEPNLMDLVIGATTKVKGPASLDVLIESRINHPVGTAKIRLRNWTTNAFQEVGSYEIGTAEELIGFGDIDADDRVRDADGRIELSIRHVVTAVFSAIGFDSFFDQARVLVE